MSTDFERYGWKVNEDNLKTLPEDAPQAAKDLAKWLTLEGRRSSLQEWINCCQDDGRIHGKFWHIGAWTHRMSHSAPNQANIMSTFHGTPKSPVEEVKAMYDNDLRSCWESDRMLLGCDAESIQLRILAHYMESDTYIKAICDGVKADETDIHNVNKRALGPICRDRDTAKTWIYAWLLGAATPKQASILGCSIPQAKEAEGKFLKALPELDRLRKVKIKKDASRGYFIGLDGRKVPCNSEHLMLSGYLQNGEAVVVKNWVIDFVKEAKAERLDFKLVDVVHDEAQCEVRDRATGNRLLEIQKESMINVGKRLGVKCPLAADGRIGFNWKETH